MAARQHVTAGLAARLTAARAAIAQGLIPLPAGLGGHQASAAVTASQQAMTSALHAALAVITVLAATASLAAISLIKSPARAQSADLPGDDR